MLEKWFRHHLNHYIRLWVKNPKVIIEKKIMKLIPVKSKVVTNNWDANDYYSKKKTKCQQI